MAQNKELYTEHGEKWVMETNDFWYYMHLKKQKVPTKYNEIAWHSRNNYAKTSFKWYKKV